MVHGWTFLILYATLAWAGTQDKKYTIQDIHNAECNVGCRRGGYQSGTFVVITNEVGQPQSGCQCSDLLKFETITKKTLDVPKAAKNNTNQQY